MTRIAIDRSLRTALLSALASASFCAAVDAAAPPEVGGLAGEIPDRVARSAAACGPVFEGSRAAGADCLSGEFGGFLVGAAARFAESEGRAVLGENFRVVHRLSWSPFGEGLSGNLDAVIPLGFLSGGADAAADRPGRAVFLQQGVTRWRDKDGYRRNDARLGAGYRFALSDAPGADALGVQAVVQENLERGHRRLVAGVDYMGRWGIGSLQHYVPASGWLPGRAGYEERPVGGTRLGLRFDATTTVSVDLSFARWDGAGPGRPADDGRVALGWRPHPWLSFETGVAGVGSAAESGAVRALLRVPLGGGGYKFPRWSGLGVAGGAGAPADLWRPIENVERLETVERAVAPARPRIGEISARFLQDRAPTGDVVRVEVSIPAALDRDLALELRLEPGGGDNPAVAGEDFVDEPVAATVPRGETSTRVDIRLLHNADMRSARSLSVAIAFAA